MTWEDDMKCTCGHSIDVHADHCLVPDCGCRKSDDRVYDRYVASTFLDGRQ